MTPSGILRASRVVLSFVVVLSVLLLAQLRDAPALGTDSLIYHLTIPALWLQDGFLTQADLPQRVARSFGRHLPGYSVQLGDVTYEVGGVHVGRQVVVLGRVPEPQPQIRAGVGRVDAEQVSSITWHQ